MPLYRHDANIIFFVHIPKTGGSSIERGLKKAGAREALKFKKKRAYSKSTLQHMHASVYKEAVGSKFVDYAFTVVRNPFDRFASEYKMKVIDAGVAADAHDWAVTNFNRFAEFAFTRDNHIRPQTEFLSEWVEVFRFENGLEAPMVEACGHLGLSPPTLTHSRRGSSARINVRRETLDAIRTFYSEDFLRLGYAADDFASSFQLID
jgi:hypothetical protein